MQLNIFNASAYTEELSEEELALIESLLETATIVSSFVSTKYDLPSWAPSEALALFESIEAEVLARKPEATKKSVYLTFRAVLRQRGASLETPTPQEALKAVDPLDITPPSLPEEIKVPNEPPAGEWPEIRQFLDKVGAEGVFVDKPRLNDNLAKLEAQKGSLASEIKSHGDVDPDKSASIAKFLFEDLKLPGTMRGKSGQHSVSATELSAIAKKHPVVPLIIKYSSTKYQMSQIRSFLKRIQEDGYVRWKFNTESGSGRIYAKEPNMVSVGEMIRDAVLAGEVGPDGKPARVFVSFDYDSQEFAIFISKLQVADLIDKYINNEDVHRANAAIIYEKEPEDVTSDERQKAKRALYGSFFGQSFHGLARDLGISSSEAEKLQQALYRAIPEFKAKFDAMKQKILKEGIVTTEGGRVYDLNRSTDNLLKEVDRLLSKFSQGTGSDILVNNIKIFRDDILNKFPESKFILPVHDSVVLSVPNDASYIKDFKDYVNTKVVTKVFGMPLNFTWSQGPTLNDVLGH